MSNQIRDTKGIVAEVRQSGTDQVLYGYRAPNQGILGRYCQYNNTTYDKNGRIVGHGNLLMTLVRS